jgi:hypothetical protein
MLLAALALLAAETPFEPVAADTTPVEPMAVEIVRDPITDEIRAFATARDDGHRLVVSCEPSDYDGARVSVHSRRWLARGNIFTGERPVIYRFDSLTPQRSMWDVEDRSGRIASSRRAASFIGHLMSAEKLVIRARDIEGHLFDMVFRLREVRPAVEQALAACDAAS